MATSLPAQRRARLMCSQTAHSRATHHTPSPNPSPPFCNGLGCSRTPGNTPTPPQSSPFPHVPCSACQLAMSLASERHQGCLGSPWAKGQHHMHSGDSLRRAPLPQRWGKREHGLKVSLKLAARSELGLKSSHAVAAASEPLTTCRSRAAGGRGTDPWGLATADGVPVYLLGCP